jgi:hypothetical protein
VKIICADEVQGTQLCCLCESWSGCAGRVCSASLFSSAAQALAHAPFCADLVLFRIEAESADMLAAARNMLEEDAAKDIAFVSAAPQKNKTELRLQAQELLAMDLLEEPVDRASIQDLLDRVDQHARGSADRIRMTRQKMRALAPVFLVRLSGTEQETCGTVFNGLCPKESRFVSLAGLLLEIDRMCDYLQYPQRQRRLRSFFRRRKGCRAVQLDDPAQRCAAKTVKPEKAGRLNFTVWVRFREHESLQGTVCWLDRGRCQNFSSGLELLYLLEEAVRT